MGRLLTRLALATAILGALPAAASAATITIVHGIPGFRADVYLNGAKRLTGFHAGEMTPPVSLAAGRYRLAIRKAGDPASARPVLSGALVLGSHDVVSIVAHLNRRGRPTLSLYHDRTVSLAPGQAAVVIRPAAALPPIDVLIDGKRAFRRLRQTANVTTVVAAGTHQIAFVVSATRRTVWGPNSVTLRAGKVYAIYPVGSLRQRTLDQLVATFSARALPPKGVPAGTSGLVATNAPAVAATSSARALDGRVLLIAAAGAIVLLCGFVLVRPQRA
jgi:hypothetical protein